MNSEGITYLDRVEALVTDRRWSEERARREAAEVLGREEVPPLDELPDEDLRKLIAAWERVNDGPEDEGCGVCTNWRLRWMENPEREIPNECPRCGRNLRIPLEWTDAILAGEEPGAGQEEGGEERSAV